MTTKEILLAAKAAAPVLAAADTERKNQALLAMADALEADGQLQAAFDLFTLILLLFHDLLGIWLSLVFERTNAADFTLRFAVCYKIAFTTFVLHLSLLFKNALMLGL